MVIPPQETLSVEFKSDLKRVSDDVILDSVVALANTDGGTLYLGVEDDGTPTGIHESHRDTTRLAVFVANKTVPPLSARVETGTFQTDSGEAMVIAIQVPRSPAIVATASGKMLRRRTRFDGSPESVPMYPYEIASRLSTLRSYDYSATPVSGASTDDLDPRETMRLQELVRANGKADMTLVGLSDEELMRALHLVSVDGGLSIPTVAGILLLGRRDAVERYVPAHGAAFQVLEGTAARLDKDYGGPLLPIIDDMEQALRAWNPEVELFDGFYRISVPEFDASAAREGIVNAFGHRDYAMLGQVRVQVDERGLTVTSPGEFVDGVTSANLLKVDPRSRNLCLMDALKRICVAERTGRGVDRICEGSLQVGRRLPEWTESKGAYVSLFMPRGRPDEGFMRLLEETRRRTGADPSIWAMLLLDALRDSGSLTTRGLCERTHMTEGEVETALERLVAAGIVEQRQSVRSRQFHLNDELYAGRSYDHPGLSRRQMSRDDYPPAVLDRARRAGSVTTGEVANMLNVSTKQAYRVLASLVEKGDLRRQGSGAGTRYMPIASDREE